MADYRDDTTWVALELTKTGEQKVEEGVLEEDLRDALGVEEAWPIFIPSKTYSKGGKKVTVHLMEGYAFVASGLDEVVYFRLEQVNKLVSKVITAKASGVRILSTITEVQVETLRRQLAERIATDITPGMSVGIVSGKYKGLEGVVDTVDGEFGVVYIKLRALEVLASIPRVFLEAKLED